MYIVYTSESVLITLRFLWSLSWNCVHVQQKTFTLFCELQSRDSSLILLQNNHLFLFEKFKYGVDFERHQVEHTWCLYIIFKH